MKGRFGEQRASRKALLAPCMRLHGGGTLPRFWGHHSLSAAIASEETAPMLLSSGKEQFPKGKREPQGWPGLGSEDLTPNSCSKSVPQAFSHHHCLGLTSQSENHCHLLELMWRPHKTMKRNNLLCQFCYLPLGKVHPISSQLFTWIRLTEICPTQAAPSPQKAGHTFGRGSKWSQILPLWHAS